jgi:hypothetical protein
MYQKAVSAFDYKLWDLGNITASDFTLQMELTKAHWQRWTNTQYVRGEA